MINDYACQLASALFVLRPSAANIRNMLRDPEFFAAIQEHCEKTVKTQTKRLPGDPKAPNPYFDRWLETYAEESLADSAAYVAIAEEGLDEEHLSAWRPGNQRTK